MPRLVVGRAGIGEIAFLYPVDLRGLDLDATVSLERGRFALYPGAGASSGGGGRGSPKNGKNAAAGRSAPQRRPPPGEGLNVPAIVTLSGMRVRDPGNRLAVEAFRGRLLAAAARMGAVHVHFDPEGEGVWMLKVDSFP